MVSIIGDLGREQARTLAEQLTSGMKAAAPLPELPPIPRLAKEQVSRIAHEATQAHILIGQPGIKRLDPDYFPLWVGNYVLGGGGFSSRLNEEIRQKRGFAYSAYSYSTRSHNRDHSRSGFRPRRIRPKSPCGGARHAREIRHDGPTQENSKPRNRTSSADSPCDRQQQKILEYLSVIGFYRLPPSIWKTFPRRSRP